MVNLITEINEPLNESIQTLNDLLAESQLDRKKLNHVAESNTELINDLGERTDDHNERLIVLEVKNGIRKIAYKEGYEKEDSNE